MCKKTAILLLAVLVPGLCLAQGGPGGFRMRGGGGLIQQLGEDVRVLQQFDTLALTDAQINAILPLYKQYPAADVLPEQKPLVDKLTEARARLLTGTPLAVGEMAALLDEFRKFAQQGRGGPGRGPQQDNQPVTLSPLAAAIWGQLTQTQKAALLGDVRGAAANNQRADRVAAEQAMKLIGKLRASDDATWTANRDRLIALLSAGAGEPDSAARKNSASMFSDFLDRVRQMSDADFAQKQEELVASLIALLPPGTILTATLAEFDPGQLMGAMFTSFLSPRGSALLQELQTSRVKLTQ